MLLISLPSESRNSGNFLTRIRWLSFIVLRWAILRTSWIFPFQNPNHRTTKLLRRYCFVSLCTFPTWTWRVVEWFCGAIEKKVHVYRTITIQRRWGCAMIARIKPSDSALIHFENVAKFAAGYPIPFELPNLRKNNKCQTQSIQGCNCTCLLQCWGVFLMTIAMSAHVTGF